jgi:hypothetical protein
MPATVPIRMLIAGEARVGLRPEFRLCGEQTRRSSHCQIDGRPSVPQQDNARISAARREVPGNRAHGLSGKSAGRPSGQGANLGPYSRAGRTRRARGMFQRGPCSLLGAFAPAQDFNALPSAVRWRALAGLPSGPTVRPYFAKASSRSRALQYSRALASGLDGAGRSTSTSMDFLRVRRGLEDAADDNAVAEHIKIVAGRARGRRSLEDKHLPAGFYHRHRCFPQSSSASRFYCRCVSVLHLEPVGRATGAKGRSPAASTRYPVECYGGPSPQMPALMRRADASAWT